MSRRSRSLDGQNLPTAPYSTHSTAGPSRSTLTQPLSDGTPDFEEWTTAQLQAEVKRYGFKVSRKRATLVDQLKAVYEALHKSKAPYDPPDAAETHDGNEQLLQDVGARFSTTSNTKNKGKGKGRKSDPYVLDASSEASSPTSSGSVAFAEAVAGDYTAQLEAEALSSTDGELSTSGPSPRRRPRSKSKSPALSSSSEDVPLATLRADVEDDGNAVDPSPTLAQTMTAAIRSDASLWGRILRYEPISFDEFVSVATQNSLNMDTGKRKEELRTWLDRQCICFYTNELTGSRSRH